MRSSLHGVLARLGRSARASELCGASCSQKHESFWTRAPLCARNRCSSTLESVCGARNRCPGLLGATCGARNHCSGLLGSTCGARIKSLLRTARSHLWCSNSEFRPAGNRLWRAISLPGPAWRRLWRSTSLRSHCSKSLGLVTLSALLLHIVLHCFVHGYTKALESFPKAL